MTFTFVTRTTTPGSRREVVEAPDRAAAMQMAARIFGSAPLMVERHDCYECRCCDQCYRRTGRAVCATLCPCPKEDDQ